MNPRFGKVRVQQCASPESKDTDLPNPESAAALDQRKVDAPFSWLRRAIFDHVPCELEEGLRRFASRREPHARRARCPTHGPAEGRTPAAPTREGERSMCSTTVHFKQGPGRIDQRSPGPPATESAHASATRLAAVSKRLTRRSRHAQPHSTVHRRPPWQSEAHAIRAHGRTPSEPGLRPRGGRAPERW